MLKAKFLDILSVGCLCHAPLLLKIVSLNYEGCILPKLVDCPLLELLRVFLEDVRMNNRGMA